MPDFVHLGRTLDSVTFEALAEFVCGDDASKYPTYRSSTHLTRFFQSIEIDATHDGSTRKWWVLGVLERLSPGEIERVILRLTDLREYRGSQENLGLAVRTMNSILAIDGFAIGFDGVRPGLKRAGPIVFDGDAFVTAPRTTDEEEFLGRQFTEHLDIGELGLDTVITSYLQARVDEAQACPRDKVPLGTIFLLGSTLEGLLLSFAVKHPAKFMSSPAAPKDAAEKAKKTHDWKLSELIDVAHEVGLLGVDVKKFSHALRDFRNYVHPYQQMSQGFQPDQHTVDICWQVFRASFAQLKAKGA